MSVWDLVVGSLEALLIAAPSENQGSQPPAAYSTYVFQYMCGRHAVYLVYSGKLQDFPRNYNSWKQCRLRCREENVQTRLAHAFTCSLCPLGPTCAFFLEDWSFYRRDDGQVPSRQMNQVVHWLREGNGNGSGQGQAAWQQEGGWGESGRGKLKHYRSFGCLPSACFIAEAKNLHHPQRGLSLSASLPDFSLGFSWHHPPPLASPKMCVPSMAVFLACGFPFSPFCGACMQIGVTACNSCPPCAPAAAHLLVQVPWWEGQPKRRVLKCADSMSETRKNCKTLVTEGICSPLIPASVPFSSCALQRVGQAHSTGSLAGSVPCARLIHMTFVQLSHYLVITSSSSAHYRFLAHHRRAACCSPLFLWQLMYHLYLLDLLPAAVLCLLPWVCLAPTSMFFTSPPDCPVCPSLFPHILWKPHPHQRSWSLHHCNEHSEAKMFLLLLHMLLVSCEDQTSCHILSLPCTAGD